MAIDELTDEAFFKLYQKNPEVKKLVEGIQKKYHVHHSQTKDPDREKVSAATKESKDIVKHLINEQKPKTYASASEKFSSNSEYTALFLGGLAAALGFATGAPLLGAAALLTATWMMYNNYQSKYKTA